MRFISVVLILISSFAFTQETGTPVFLPNQTVRVADLSDLAAPSTSAAAVVRTSLEIILGDKSVCCGKNSALEDDVGYATQSNPISLKQLAEKMQGKHRLSDGRPVSLNSEFVPQNSVYATLIVRSLLDQHASLMEWDSHFYVLYGAVFDETRYSNGTKDYVIQKLLLVDPRFSDERREAVFNRAADDWGKVGGLLQVAVAKE